MPRDRFAELISEVDGAVIRRLRRFPDQKESVIGRIAMRRMPSSAQRISTRRTQPVIEGLEDRWLLSHVSPRQSIATTAASSNGTLSPSGTEFTYTTNGAHVVVQMVGIGNLTGTSVDSSGALDLVFGGTNAYSKIVGHVTGGNGHATLASIVNSELSNELNSASNPYAAQTSLSGLGGNVIQGVYLKQFDLVPGGNINLTSGVNTVLLDTIAGGTQVHLRELPPPPAPTTTSTSSTLGVVTTQSGSTTGAAVRSTTTSSSAAGTTLQALQSTSVTNEGVTTTYKANVNGGQTLTSISGSFTPGANIVEPLATGAPGQTPHPAPPGVILKVNRVEGNTAGAINLLMDPVIFGYDATDHDLVRFTLNLKSNTGAQDPNFTPIPVPGAPSSVGLNLGWDGSELVVLVSSGNTVYAYDANTSGPPVGYFTYSSPVSSIAMADTVTVLGSYTTNQLQMINLSASLQSHTAVPVTGNPKPFSPAAGFTLLGGLTGTPGSTSVTAAVGAIFNTFTPTQYQLGSQSINTVSVGGKNSPLSNSFTAATAAAVTQHGTYTPVQVNPPVPTQPGAALGSIDQSTALVTGASGGNNTIMLSSGGTLKLNYGDLLVALSESFRPDLQSSALIDIQGDVQSVRGSSANGMVLNDNGNLNLVKFASVTNSTIVGQPFSHLQVIHRSHVTVLTPSRTITGSLGPFKNDGRNAVTVDKSLNPIGPLF